MEALGELCGIAGRRNCFGSRSEGHWWFALLARQSALFAGLLVLSGFVPATSAADLVQPFYSRNMSPFVQIYGLPATEDAALTPKGNLATRLVFDVANNYTDSSANGESILIHGETYRTVVAVRYGLWKNLEIGIDIPYLQHHEGSLNNFIYDWHDFFGMSQGSRTEDSDDRLSYRYSENGSNLVDMIGSASGLGDILLAAGVPLWNSGADNGKQLTLRAALKLPTGSSSELLGSGSTDFSLRLTGEDRQTFAKARIACFGTLGVLLLTDGDIIAHRQRNAVGFGSVGLGWQPLTRLALKLQIDANSAFYDSDLTELGDFSAQLIMGGSVGLPADFQLDLAVSEDIVVETAPDVTFHLALSKAF